MGFGGGGSGSAGAGILESAEQSILGDVVTGVSLAPNSTAVNGNFTTMPNTNKYMKITALEWTNFATISGNVQALVWKIDQIVPSSPNVILIAATAVVAQAGASQVQKVSVPWSSVLSGGDVLFMGIVTSSATATFSFKVIGARNCFKLLTIATVPTPFDSTAWGANTNNLADTKIYFKAYN